MKILDGRRRGSRTVFGVLTFFVTTTVLAGCGTTVTGKPEAGEFDIRKLSVGTYPIDPIDVRASYTHSPSSGRELAIGRLADAVAVGPDVDPSFNHGVISVNLQVTVGINLVLSDAAKPVAVRNNMMFGYAASASTKPLSTAQDPGSLLIFSPFGGMKPDPDATSFNVTVLQFPDQQRAAAAAEQMEAADFDVAPDQNQRVSLDKYPEAKAHWRPGIPSMGTSVAHDRYVVNVFVQQPSPDVAGLKSLTEKVLAAQLPLLDHAPALSPRDVLRLDYDPQGLLRRTLHPGTYPAPDAENELTRTPRGFLHQVDDQAKWKTLLDDNGVDSIATTRNGALLMRARDPNAAAALWSGITSAAGTPANQPTDVPDTACSETTTPVTKPQRYDDEQAWDKSDRFLCTLHYGRYVARVAGTQLADVIQRAGAQYALLANSQYM
ncbi:hypothetical protein ACFXG4_08930 [Nocardia sp. NPDC059246]|uniref:DUF7373 family lipoprotein n=1 Tax=unclassified Nocardia TaxID=2637762 RepID=UPI00369BC2F1